MVEVQTKKGPIFKRRVQFVLAFPQRRGKRHDSWTNRNPARERPILELVVKRLFHRALHVLTQDISFAHGSPVAALYRFVRRTRRYTLSRRVT